MEVSDQSFNIVDIKPVNMEDLTGTYAYQFTAFMQTPCAAMCEVSLTAA